MVAEDNPLLIVWSRFPELVKSLINDDSLALAVEALKSAEAAGSPRLIKEAIEILDFIVEVSYSQGDK